MERVGIYGGTFNPPHVGHKNALRAFALCEEIDRILVIPDYLPPHKEMSADVSARDRLEMARLAFFDVPKAEISDMELCREGRSYTVDTLRSLVKEDRELALLVGTDMFLTLDRWFCFEEIFRLATIYCVRRECDGDVTEQIQSKAQEYRDRYGARISFVPADAVEVSSTDLRSWLASQSDAVDDLLDPRVYEYIRERGLYR